MNIKEALNHIINTTTDETIRSRAIEILQIFQSSHISNTGFGDRVIIKVLRKEEKGDTNINS